MAETTSNTKYYLGGLGLLLLAIIGLFVWNNKDNGKTCFNLSKEVDPARFGPSYWAAFHDLAHMVPCPGCRGFAEKFIVFFHDTVNMKTGKPLFDPDNFKMFTQLFADINSGKDPFHPQETASQPA